MPGGHSPAFPSQGTELSEGTRGPVLGLLLVSTAIASQAGSLEFFPSDKDGSTKCGLTLSSRLASNSWQSSCISWADRHKLQYSVQKK